MDEQRRFIARFAPFAVINSLFSGVPPSITMAQAILESGWGKYAICNNLFGIKKHDWKGAICSAGTHENYDGENVYITADFRAYLTPLGSIRDHAKFLHENPRYSGLFELPFTDYTGWAYGLKAAGYATSPTYAQKLITLIEDNNLQRLDTTAQLLKIMVFALVAFGFYWAFKKLK